MGRAHAAAKSDIGSSVEQRLTGAELASSLRVKVGIERPTTYFRHGLIEQDRNATLRVGIKLSVHPFPNVAYQLADTVRRIAFRDRLYWYRAVNTACPNVRFRWIKSVAPRIPLFGTVTRMALGPSARALPFLGCWQSFSNPSCVGVCLVPADPHDGMMLLIRRRITLRPVAWSGKSGLVDKLQHTGQDFFGPVIGICVSVSANEASKSPRLSRGSKTS